LTTQLPASEFVLETFENVRTLFNPNASRFGKYTELQFSDRGKLTGVKTLDYYLEQNLVATIPSGERNFYISLRVHRLRGNTYTSWIKPCTSTWDRMGQRQLDQKKP
jgi:hypothetical protein